MSFYWWFMGRLRNWRVRRFLKCDRKWLYFTE